MKLPFVLDVADFLPLQPEDSDVEEARRNNPAYAQLYRYRSVELLGQTTPEAVVTLEYDQWLEICRRMDEEVRVAKAAWHQAVVERDAAIAEARARAERARAHYREIELRQKPPQPRSARRKA